MSIKKVIIVGAGPAGLLLALLLSKTGIQVDVLEQYAAPTNETRAIIYQAISQAEFKRAGILEEVIAAGTQYENVQGWSLTGEKLFSLPGMGQIALKMNTLADIVRTRLEGSVGSRMLYNHKVVEISAEDSQDAWVRAETPDGIQTINADYIVACDGGKSTIRRLLFGERSMPGFTWDKSLVGADIRGDFPGLSDSNLIFDPEDACVMFRSSSDPTEWRFIYNDAEAKSQKDIEARAAARVSELLPTHPDPKDFGITRVSPYKIHQRIVNRMRCGKFILASDAAHLCCPYGALGLNGGIADVGSLTTCFEAIHSGAADDTILDEYDRVRREKWNTIINPQSQGTLKMIFSDPANIQNTPMYRMSVGLREDPLKARQNAPNPLVLQHDFSSFINKTAPAGV